MSFSNECQRTGSDGESQAQSERDYGNKKACHVMSLFKSVTGEQQEAERTRESRTEGFSEITEIEK